MEPNVACRRTNNKRDDSRVRYTHLVLETKQQNDKMPADTAAQAESGTGTEGLK